MTYDPVGFGLALFIFAMAFLVVAQVLEVVVPEILKFYRIYGRNF